MATTFIAKHGLKSNINKLKLSEGEIAIAYSEDKTKAEIYSGSKDGTPILLIQEINVSELLANANEYTNTKISELVDGAPEAMDTLKELADAIAQNSDIMSALQSAIGNKANEAELSGHISDTNNPHTVTKEQLGLENVDNTSDIDKPISTAMQEALNDKAPTNHASSATTYGMGNATNYGHLKLSDSTASVSSTGSGIAATPKAVKTISDTLSTEISDRQAADNELKAKISEINTELTTDNLFYDLSKYVNSGNKLVTDDSGVQYLSYSGSFENGTYYLYHNFVVDNFRRKPKTETALELTFNVASRHIAGDGCDIGGLNIGKTDVLITYTDTTTERFGQSYYTATDTGDKTITINGTSETYKTTKFKIEIPVTKEIKSISFRIVSDNFYTNGDPTGNACKQKTLIQSAVCYDDECVAVLRDDINANTSKITANTTKITEIDKTVTDISKNQIFVVCDGDHDELKLQAAIDSAQNNSVIYPVGTQCVLTNENTIRGYGLPESSGRAVISLKSGITLDGSMCDDFVFKNTNPVAKQYIFHMTQSTTMKNVVFHEDTETVTADTVNPTVLSVGSESKIVSCTFYNIFSTHQFGVSTFEMNGVLFVDNIIDTFAGAPANNLTEIKITGNSFVAYNKFLNFTQKEQSLGYMLQASTVIFVNNYMSGFTNCSIDIGKKIVGNIFKTFTDCSIDISGEISDNEFTTITQNTKTPFIYTTGVTLISGNRMSVIKINAEYIDFIECGNYAVICGNYMRITAGPASGQCNLIAAGSKALIADNMFRALTPVTANADFSIIYSAGDTVVKNNVTTATSIGTFGDTCVVDGNVTWG